MSSTCTAVSSTAPGRGGCSWAAEYSRADTASAAAGHRNKRPLDSATPRAVGGTKGVGLGLPASAKASRWPRVSETSFAMASRSPAKRASTSSSKTSFSSETRSKASSRSQSSPSCAPSAAPAWRKRSCSRPARRDVVEFSAEAHSGWSNDCTLKSPDSAVGRPCEAMVVRTSDDRICAFCSLENDAMAGKGRGRGGAGGQFRLGVRSRALSPERRRQDGVGRSVGRLTGAARRPGKRGGARDAWRAFCSRTIARNFQKDGVFGMCHWHACQWSLVDTHCGGSLLRLGFLEVFDKVEDERVDEVRGLVVGAMAAVWQRDDLLDRPEA
mmetsp:Transcript_5516/g.19633  ORF Transcript_5516/g.19633 Transcript_5516/m.19633 type:complete len:327 (+) Transcript_5516:1809-2789(+)